MQTSYNSSIKRYVLAQSIRRVINEMRERMIVCDPEELVPKMLAVGRTRGTPDFEDAVKDLLAVLARRIPSTKYCQGFEKYI